MKASVSINRNNQATFILLRSSSSFATHLDFTLYSDIWTPQEHKWDPLQKSPQILSDDSLKATNCSFLTWWFTSLKVDINERACVREDWFWVLFFRVTLTGTRAAGKREHEQHDEEESEEDEEEEERMGAGLFWCADADSPLAEASFRAGLKGRSRQVGTNFDPECFCHSGESGRGRGSCRCAEIRSKVDWLEMKKRAEN